MNTECHGRGFDSHWDLLHQKLFVCAADTLNDALYVVHMKKSVLIQGFMQP